MARGVLLILLSSACFGTSGALARGLLDAGWTPGGAVLVRVAGAAAVLGVVVAVRYRGALVQLRGAWRTVVVYGVVGVAGVQLAYFTAVETLPVAVALLIEYLGPVLVIGWMWARGQRPAARVLGGGALALVGTAFVLDVTGGGVRVDPVGVAWALGAAVGLACYFVVLGRAADDPTSEAVDPVVLSAGGLAVGTLVLGAAAAVGVMPVRLGGGTALLAGAEVALWIPVVALVLVSTVLAYAVGAAGTARLGATAASLLGLSEVLAAVAVAWVLLGQLPSPVQLAGGALVVLGVALTQLRGRRRAVSEVPGVRAAAPVPSA